MLCIQPSSRASTLIRLCRLQWVLLGRIPSDPEVASKRVLWQLRCHMFEHIMASPLNGIAGTLW
jgi:hypothetical protein